jgi:hypothetical protein
VSDTGDVSLWYWSGYSKQGKWVVMYMCVSGITFVCFYDSSIGFWYYSDSMIFLFFILLGKNWNIQNENLGKGSLDKIEIFKMKTWEKVA